MQYDTDFFLGLLDKLLLELRNLESHELEYAPKLAYLMHNVPSLVQSHLQHTSGEAAWAVMQGRAAALGLSSWLTEAEQNVRSRQAMASPELP